VQVVEYDDERRPPGQCLEEAKHRRRELVRRRRGATQTDGPSDLVHSTCTIGRSLEEAVQRPPAVEPRGLYDGLAHRVEAQRGVG